MNFYVFNYQPCSSKLRCLLLSYDVTHSHCRSRITSLEYDDDVTLISDVIVEVSDVIVEISDVIVEISDILV